jgi:hypothetical protein
VVLQLHLLARLRLLQRVQRLAELAPAHQLLALTQKLLELGSIPLGLGHQASLEAGARLLQRRGVPVPKFAFHGIAPLPKRRYPLVPFFVERVPSPRLLLALSAETPHQRRDVRVVRARSRAHPRHVVPPPRRTPAFNGPSDFAAPGVELDLTAVEKRNLATRFS